MNNRKSIKKYLAENFIKVLSGMLLVVVLLFAVLTLHQVKRIENVYIDRINNIVKLNFNDFLNEIALKDYISLQDHLKILKDQLMVDKIHLTLDNGFSLLEGPMNDESFFKIYKPHIIEFSDQQNYFPSKLTVYFDHSLKKNFLIPLFTFYSFTLSLFILFVIFLFLFIYIKIKKEIMDPLSSMTDSFINITPLRSGNEKLFEINKLIEAVNSYSALIEEKKSIEISSEKAMALSKMARQVSHDVRSPLAALNMIIRQNLKELPEETRISIRQQIDRIQDIANSLLIKNKQPHTNADDAIMRTELLSSIIEEIITEKRLNFRAHLNLSIEGDIYDKQSYGLFAKINLREMKRLLSNLINNAAEALSNYRGKITIKLLSPDEKSINILVEDNGRGIPKEILESLGAEGMSYGKENNAESGNGLGLHHAHTTIEKWGGKINITSEVAKGTTITIILPKAETPKWFISKLSLWPSPKQAVVILDDDQGIHHTWDNRLKENSIDKYEIKVFHLSTPSAFREWVENHKYAYDKILYLSDFELLDFKESGLDLLEELKLNNAILVTSHYENEKIRDRCDRLGVRLMPKMLAGFVPIEFEIPENCSNSEKPANTAEISGEYYDYLYIEDDEWLRKGWEFAAKKSKLNIKTLSSTEEFYQYQSKVAKEHTEIYLDKNLGNNKMPGDEFAKILHQQGYKRLTLATGEDPHELPKFDWLKISGKECPFDNEE
ncbi:MAG: HAMP domain-containing histidine kinase [Oligoflexia bacterium]|nr:HAMP domain-containing histidine kinase [Oligoflexia bacterium]